MKKYHVTQNLKTDIAEEVTIWLALRRTKNEQNDILVYLDRKEVVQRFMSARVRNNI